MNPFYEVMRHHPDAKLLDIAENKRSDYQPEALAAAEKVLSERNLSWKKSAKEKTPLNGFGLAEREQELLEKRTPPIAVNRRRRTTIIVAMTVIIAGCFVFVSVAPGPSFGIAFAALFGGLILLSLIRKK